jgi:uncharacterized membrane protein
MKTLKNDWLIGLIILSPFVLIAMKWNLFPEQVPMHWNFHGEIDRYGSKITGLLLLPGINILLYVLFLVLPILDPQRKNYALFADKFKIIRMMIHLLMTCMTFIVCLVSLGYQLNVGMLVQIGVVCLMLVFGNFMGNIRQNYFIGIRTPWTLANEQVWTVTHRFAGKLWVAASLLMLPLCIFSKGNFDVLFISYLAVIVIIPIVYSFIKFKQISSGKEA